MLDLSYDLFNNTFLMANKLFCTFTAPEELDNTLNTLTTKYTILYSKIFVLESLSTEEYVCTYNIDTFNMEQQSVLPNTILFENAIVAPDPIAVELVKATLPDVTLAAAPINVRLLPVVVVFPA